MPHYWQVTKFISNLIGSIPFRRFIICTYKIFYWTRTLFYTTAILYLDSTREKKHDFILLFSFLWPIDHKFEYCFVVIATSKYRISNCQRRNNFKWSADDEWRVLVCDRTWGTDDDWYSFIAVFLQKFDREWKTHQQHNTSFVLRICSDVVVIVDLIMLIQVKTIKM